MPEPGLADPERPQTMPYKAEYAKSGRASCKKCSKPIRHDELRIAAQVKSRLFDGMQTNWHHLDCFFIRYRPTTVGDIDNFETLRIEDQKKIEHKIDEMHSKEMSPGKNTILSDFKVEYPKSSKSMCPACEDYIRQDEPRIGKLDSESENSRRFGPRFRWHHVDCFAKARHSFGFTASGEELSGFDDLEEEHQEEIRDKLPSESSPRKRSGGQGYGRQPKKQKNDNQEKSEEEDEDKMASPEVRQQRGRARGGRHSAGSRKHGGKASEEDDLGGFIVSDDDEQIEDEPELYEEEKNRSDYAERGGPGGRGRGGRGNAGSRAQNLEAGDEDYEEEEYASSGQRARGRNGAGQRRSQRQENYDEDEDENDEMEGDTRKAASVIGSKSRGRGEENPAKVRQAASALGRKGAEARWSKEKGGQGQGNGRQSQGGRQGSGRQVRTYGRKRDQDEDEEDYKPGDEEDEEGEEYTEKGGSGGKSKAAQVLGSRSWGGGEQDPKKVRQAAAAMGKKGGRARWDREYGRSDGEKEEPEDEEEMDQDYEEDSRKAGSIIGSRSRGGGEQDRGRVHQAASALGKKGAHVRWSREKGDQGAGRQGQGRQSYGRRRRQGEEGSDYEEDMREEDEDMEDTSKAAQILGSKGRGGGEQDPGKVREAAAAMGRKGGRVRQGGDYGHGSHQQPKRSRITEDYPSEEELDEDFKPKEEGEDAEDAPGSVKKAGAILGSRSWGGGVKDSRVVHKAATILGHRGGELGGRTLWTKIRHGDFKSDQPEESPGEEFDEELEKDDTKGIGSTKKAAAILGSRSWGGGVKDSETVHQAASMMGKKGGTTTWARIRQGKLEGEGYESPSEDEGQGRGRRQQRGGRIREYQGTSKAAQVLGSKSRGGGEQNPDKVREAASAMGSKGGRARWDKEYGRKDVQQKGSGRGHERSRGYEEENEDEDYGKEDVGDKRKAGSIIGSRSRGGGEQDRRRVHQAASALGKKGAEARWSKEKSAQGSGRQGEGGREGYGRQSYRRKRNQDEEDYNSPEEEDMEGDKGRGEIGRNTSKAAQILGSKGGGEQDPGKVREAAAAMGRKGGRARWDKEKGGQRGREHEEYDEEEYEEEEDVGGRGGRREGNQGTRSLRKSELGKQGAEAQRSKGRQGRRSSGNDDYDEEGDEDYEPGEEVGDEGGSSGKGQSNVRKAASTLGSRSRGGGAGDQSVRKTASTLGSRSSGGSGGSNRGGNETDPIEAENPDDLENEGVAEEVLDEKYEFKGKTQSEQKQVSQELEELLHDRERWHDDDAHAGLRQRGKEIPKKHYDEDQEDEQFEKVLEEDQDTPGFSQLSQSSGKGRHRGGGSARDQEVSLEEELEGPRRRKSGNGNNRGGGNEEEIEDEDEGEEQEGRITRSRRGSGRNQSGSRFGGGQETGQASQRKSRRSSNAQGGGNEEDNYAVMEKQNKRFYEVLDAIKYAHNNREVTKPQLIHLLEYNNAEIPDAGESLYDLLADMITFGALKKCPSCKRGQFVYKSGVGYICTGNISDRTKCSFETDDPPRVPFKVPKDLVNVPFLKKFHTEATEKRAIPKHEKPGSADASTLKPYHGPKVKENPLEHFRFFTDPDIRRKPLDQKLRAFGGKVSSYVDPKNAKVAVVISSEEKVKSGEEDFIPYAKEHSIPVVSAAFYDALDEVDFELVDKIEEYLICDWMDREKIKEHLKAIHPDFEGTGGDKPLRIEEGGNEPVVTSILDVDPDSGLEGKAHVYSEGDLHFSEILSKVNVETGENKYYKLQVLESNSEPKKYWIFRSWGRYGTTIGKTMCQEMTKEAAVAMFHSIFEEKTSNKYGANFVTRHGHYVPMKLEDQEGTRERLVPNPRTSKLPMPVQVFVSKVFDIGLMKQTLIEYNVDVKEIPLGQIKLEQILEAYKVLADLVTVLKQEKPNQRKIVDHTNHFYTLIPHNFGNENLELLDHMDLIQSKIALLENLLEIDTAYGVLVQSGHEEESPIDARYKALNCDISVLDKGSDLWKQLEQYLLNTHGPTHNEYKMEVVNICNVERADEVKRFAKFKSYANRKLLWHGTRVSNLAGIMYHGLRVAPPAAPPTGYMFGKGIYFTDCSSKSANFCLAKTHPKSGFLLLCDVALGHIATLTKGDSSLIKPPDGKDSVFAAGRMQPDPNETFTTPSGAVVPCGKLLKADIPDPDLNYNEYVIYNEDQVKIDYVVEVRFHYKPAA